MLNQQIIELRQDNKRLTRENKQIHELTKETAREFYRNDQKVEKVNNRLMLLIAGWGK